MSSAQAQSIYAVSDLYSLDCSRRAEAEGAIDASDVVQDGGDSDVDGEEGGNSGEE